MPLKASTSRHVYFEESLGTLSAFLDCVTGDIWQNYADPNNWTDDSNYTPQYSDDNFRTIELFLSATGTDSLRVASAEWRYNGILCSTQPAYFESVILNNNRAQLKIKGNIAKLSHNQSISITCKAMVGSEDSVVTTKVNATYNIAVRQQTRDTYRCTIAATNAQSNYTIGADGTPVGLRCVVFDWQGVEVSDPGLTYAWAKMVAQSGSLVWEPLGDGQSSITVGPDVVHNQALIRVQVSLDGQLICADTQTVYDMHDPVRVVPRFEPEDCRIIKGDATHAEINVYLDFERSSDGSRPDSALATFMLLDTTGNEVQDVEGRKWQNVQWKAQNPSTGEVTPNVPAFTITADDFANGGRELLLQIEADVQ